MTQDYVPTILADEVSTGGVVAGAGLTTTLLLFFENSLAKMLPYLFICLIVIAIDLLFGIRAAKKRGEEVRISRAIRRTIGKSVEYFAWAVLASSLSVATGYDIIQNGLMLIVVGIECISIAQNWYFWKFGKKVRVDALKAAEAVIEAKTGANIKGAVTIEKPKGNGTGTDGKEDI